MRNFKSLFLFAIFLISVIGTSGDEVKVHHEWMDDYPKKTELQQRIRKAIIFDKFISYNNRVTAIGKSRDGGFDLATFELKSKGKIAVQRYPNRKVIIKMAGTTPNTDVKANKKTRQNAVSSGPSTLEPGAKLRQPVEVEVPLKTSNENDEKPGRGELASKILGTKESITVEKYWDEDWAQLAAEDVLDNYWDNEIRNFKYDHFGVNNSDSTTSPNPSNSNISNNNSSSGGGKGSGTTGKSQNPDPKFDAVVDIKTYSGYGGLKDYKNKFGVILRYKSENNQPEFGFAVSAITKTFEDGNDGQTPDKILILGYSQRSPTSDIAVKAWENYALHSDAFGSTVALPKFYSGYEAAAETLARPLTTGILAYLLKFRIPALESKNPEVQFLKAWFIEKYEKENWHVAASFKLVAGGEADRFFFVVVATVVTEKKTYNIVEPVWETNDKNLPVVGKFNEDDVSMMQNLVDYIEGFCMLDPIEKEYNLKAEKDWIINKHFNDPSKAVDALIYVADFAARAYTNKDRNDLDNTPFINKGLGVINLLVEHHGIQDLPTLCAALLYETVGENYTLDNIKEHFGDEVSKIVADRRAFQLPEDCPKSIQDYKHVETSDDKFFKSLADDKNPKSANFEGSFTVHDTHNRRGRKLERSIMVNSTTLYKFWEVRRKKINDGGKMTYTEKFKLSFVSTFRIGNMAYGMYKIIEDKPVVVKKPGEKTKKTPDVEFYFTVEYEASKDYSLHIGIVGELRQTKPDEIIDQMLEEYEDALIFEKIHTGDKENNTQTGVAKLGDKEKDTQTGVAKLGDKEKDTQTGVAKLGDKEKDTQTGVAEFVQAMLYGAQRHFAFFQRRKDTSQKPYFNHIIGVAKRAIKAGQHTIESVAFKISCVLHDTAENTYTTINELEYKFGPEVANIVGAISDVTKDADGNDKDTTVKKKEQNEKAKKQSPDSATVKGADREYNLTDMSIQNCPAFIPDKSVWSFSNAWEFHKNYEQNMTTNKVDWEKMQNGAYETSMKELLKLIRQRIQPYPKLTL